MRKELILGLMLTVVVAVLVVIGWLPLANAIGLIGIACFAWFFRNETLNLWIRVGLFLLLVPLAFWVASYEPDGFSYPLLFTLADAAGNAAPYQLVVDFAKGAAGWILLYLLWPRLRANEFVAHPPWVFSMLLVAPLVIISVAIWVFDLQWQPKPAGQILQFAAVNLFITCVAEEVFLRLLLQQNLRNVVAATTTNRALQEAIPLLLVTGVFIAIHAGISGVALWVYALAGFLYGLSYTLSKNIVYPIAIHFLVNLIHFAFLTYPY